MPQNWHRVLRPKSRGGGTIQEEKSLLGEIDTQECREQGGNIGAEARFFHAAWQVGERDVQILSGR